MTPPTTRNRGESEIEHISSKLLLTEKNLVSIFKSTVVKGNSFHPITFFIHTKQKMFERTLDKVEFAIPAADAGPVRYFRQRLGQTRGLLGAQYNNCGLACVRQAWVPVRPGLGRSERPGTLADLDAIRRLSGAST